MTSTKAAGVMAGDIIEIHGHRVGEHPRLVVEMMRRFASATQTGMIMQ